MKHDDNTWDDTSAAGANSPDAAAAARKGPKENGNVRSSTERGAAADKALIEAGGTIVSRLRLRPVAARALAILMEREGQEHGKQRAAIERALIEAAGGAEALEQLAAAERAAVEAAAKAAAKAKSSEEVAALEQAQQGLIDGIDPRQLTFLDREAAGAKVLAQLAAAERAAAEAAAEAAARAQAAEEVAQQDRIDAIAPRQLNFLDQ